MIPRVGSTNLNETFAVSLVLDRVVLEETLDNMVTFVSQFSLQQVRFYVVWYFHGQQGRRLIMQRLLYCQ